MTITKVSSFSFPSRLYRHNENHGSGTDNQTTNPVDTATLTCTRSRTGTRLPKWRTIIANHGNATTALTGTWDEFSSNFVRTSFLFKDSLGNSCKRSQEGDLCFASSGPQFSVPTARTPTMSTATADNRARARFYKRLRELQVAWSGPTFLGELRETLRMIKRPASALRDSLDRYYRSLKNSKRTNPRAWNKRQEIEKIAGGLWLENSFGWQPLLNDVRDAVKAYERLTPPLADMKIISVGDTDAKDLYKTLVGEGLYISVAPSAPFRQNGTVYAYKKVSVAKEVCTVRYKGGVALETRATQWDNLALFGFTPSEFVPTAWELLPWSFLIDYFTNVGDILTSSVTKTTGVKWVNKTVRLLCQINGSIEPNAALTAQYTGSGFKVYDNRTNVGYYNTMRKTISRSVGTGVLLPTFQFETGLNIGQMCNITALLTQFIDLHPQNPPRRNWHR